MAVDVPRLPNYIDGEWRPSESESQDVPNPSDGRLLARVPLTVSEEVDRAVAAARRAWPAWRETPPVERARRIAEFLARLVADQAELAQLVARENGKTVDEAIGSVKRGIEATEFALGAPTLLQGSFLQNVSPGIDSELHREPVGVVVGITPFNFPVMIPLWMAPLAIACGNAFILKPSERVPLSADRLAHHFAASGLPNGVFNLVHGARTTVDALLVHPGVDAVAFVGSAPVARHVYATAAAGGTRVLALAGAKNFLVVLPDADLEKSANAIAASAFGQAGERCLAGSVVVAVEPVGDALVAALGARVRALKVGATDAPSTEMGPVIRTEQRDRIEGYIEAGARDGAVIAARGATPATPTGYYVAPVLFDRVRPEMSIAREEIFGPVLSVIRVASLAEAIGVANASPFGNAAAIFTRDGKAAREFSHRIEAGMVGVNVGVPAPAAYFPFVGWKGSVNGDLAATGREAVLFYTRTKVVTRRWF